MTDKISIIVPTIWKVNEFISLLRDISEHDSVGEIILIDNSDNPPDLNIKKLIHIKENKNTFVYPAWNKGYRISKYDKLCFLNDDISFDYNLFSFILPHITEEKGMIGLWEFHGSPIWRDDSGMNIASINHRNSGYGCLWFIHKKSYLEIPEEMKIWYGDDWLFNRLSNKNYGIYNLEINGVTSATSNNPEFDIIKAEDSKVFHGRYKSGHQ
jgi:hypothetical protein